MKVIAKLALAAASVILISLVIALPVMWLWNWLMPVIFGLPTISFYQTIGLMMLSYVFIKSSTTVNK
jgi:hypothetical protein